MNQLKMAQKASAFKQHVAQLQYTEILTANRSENAFAHMQAQQQCLWQPMAYAVDA